MTEKCKYATYCKYYRSKDYTCNRQDEAKTYCGAYDLFEDFKVKADLLADKNKAS